MKRMTLALALSGLLAAAATGVWAKGGVLTGVVVGVTDGDTITVLDDLKTQHNIRLAYIDAPETSCHAKRPSPRDEACVERGQPFGKAAKKHLSGLVYKERVRVEVLPGSTYGREIGVVYVRKDGRELNANLEQVRAGYAWFYRHYARQMPIKEYVLWSDAERQAREKRLGLWADPNPVAPWDYRRSQRRHLRPRH